MSDVKAPTTFVDRVTGQLVRQLTGGNAHHVHGYYDLPPWSPATGQVVLTRMSAPSAPEGEICMVEPDGTGLAVLADTRAVGANGGALAHINANHLLPFFVYIERTQPRARARRKAKP